MSIPTTFDCLAGKTYLRVLMKGGLPQPVVNNFYAYLIYQYQSDRI